MPDLAVECEISFHPIPISHLWSYCACRLPLISCISQIIGGCDGVNVICCAKGMRVKRHIELGILRFGWMVESNVITFEWNVLTEKMYIWGSVPIGMCSVDR